MFFGGFSVKKKKRNNQSTINLVVIKQLWRVDVYNTNITVIHIAMSRVIWRTPVQIVNCHLIWEFYFFYFGSNYTEQKLILSQNKLYFPRVKKKKISRTFYFLWLTSPQTNHAWLTEPQPTGLYKTGFSEHAASNRRQSTFQPAWL